MTMVTEIFPASIAESLAPEGPPVEPIRLEDSVGAVRFNPESDITALETALILNMMMRMMMPRSPLQPGIFAWRSYLSRHMLMRHFEAVPKSAG